MAKSKSNSTTSTGKRKRSSTPIRSTTRKRPRKQLGSYTEQLPEESEEELPVDETGIIKDDLWATKTILNENDTQYEVDWEGIDPKTKKPWPPSWIPKEWATKELIASWHLEKAAAKRTTAKRPAKATPTATPKATPRRKITQRADRQSRIIESSPSSSHFSPAQSTPLQPQETSLETLPRNLFPPNQPLVPRKVRPTVQIPPPPSDFDRHEYQPVSQVTLASSQQEPTSDAHDTELVSSPPHLAPTREYLSSGVIPDSQSSNGSASYILTTQEEPASIQEQSSNTANGTNEPYAEQPISAESEELESPLSSAPNSPASIPETDSIHSTQNPSQPDRREIPDTFDITETSSQLVEQLVDENKDSESIAGQSSLVETFESLSAPQIAGDKEGHYSHQQQPSQSVTTENPSQSVQQLVDADKDRATIVEQSSYPRTPDSPSKPGLLPVDEFEGQDRDTVTEESTVHETTGSPSQSAQQSVSDKGQDAIINQSSLSKTSEGSSPSVLQLVDENQAQYPPPETSKSPPPSVSESEHHNQSEEHRTVEPEESLPQQSDSDKEDRNIIIEQSALPDTVHSASLIVAQPLNEKEGQGSIAEQSLDLETSQPAPQPPAQEADQEDAVEESGSRSISQSVIQEEIQVNSIEEQPITANPSSSIAQLVYHEENQQDVVVESNSYPESTAESLFQPISPLVNQEEAQENTTTERHSPDFDLSQPEVHDAVVQANLALRRVTQDSVDRRDFAPNSQLGPTTTASADRLTAQSPSEAGASHHEQNAQIVPVDLYLSTQGDSAHSIRQTTEVLDTEEHPATPESRHDSSQQTPVLSAVSVDHSSPPPRPPFHSINTLDSNVPPRPQTPVNTSYSSNMPGTDPTDPTELQKSISEILQKRHAESPYKPKRRVLHSASPAAAAAGTRSPSTIPDRSPVQQIPTSLRTIALVNSTEAAAPAAAPAPVPAPTPSRAQPIPPLFTAPMDAGDLSDADDSVESLLNDDLELRPEEYIVPLPMEGRQNAVYRYELKRKEATLERFMAEPQDFNQMDEVYTVLKTLKAVETHMDLIFSETESSSQITGASTQVLWDVENCVKFRFLGSLFHSLRDHKMHIIIVVEEEDDKLFDILEKFCKGKLVNYQYPAKARQANLADVEGSLVVTLLASSLNPIMRPANVIISFDGASTAEIRKKNWSGNPDLPVVPILHLVIPRSVGHIERYVSSTLGPKKRLHTIFLSLAQLSSEIGQPIGLSLRAPKAAEMVSEFLVSLENDDEPPAWPLPSIGSIKDIIEYQSQLSQESILSPPLGPVTSSKRPLDDGHLDPAKRIRMTPQPQASSSANEITHISDSMPGTAVTDFQEQLAEKQRALKESDKRLRERQVILDDRQFEFEDLTKKHRLVLGELERAKESIEKANREKISDRERYTRKAAELEEWRSQFDKLQAANLASDNENVAEITRLRKELTEAKDETKRALSKAASTEGNFEYMKEVRRNAEERAAELTEQNKALIAELAVEKKKASGEVAEMKKIHHDKSHATLTKQYNQLKIRNSNLEKLLQQKEEEISRIKQSKGVGMGTRAQSVGPKASRPGSRAASPSGRDRVSNLRNG